MLALLRLLGEHRVLQVIHTFVRIARVNRPRPAVIKLLYWRKRAVMLDVPVCWIVVPRSRSLQATFKLSFLDDYHLVRLDVLGVHARVDVTSYVVWPVASGLCGVSDAICTLAQRYLALEVKDHLGIATLLCLRCR